jgi:hypothetical protein
MKAFAKLAEVIFALIIAYFVTGILHADTLGKSIPGLFRSGSL